jgi:hypothetical protein
LTQIEEGSLVIGNPSGSATGGGDVILATGTTLGGGGRIDGSVLLTRGATLDRLAGDGALSIGGGLVFERQINLNVRIGDPEQFGPYDQVTLAATVSLNGKLDVALVDGFEPALGQRFEVLVAQQITGRFDAFAGDVFDIGNRRSLVPILLQGPSETDPDRLVLAVVATGDANLDNRVDAADLNELALSWQQPPPGGPDTPDTVGADFNGDGFVNAADLNLLALNWQFGVTGPGAASGAATFEGPTDRHPWAWGVVRATVTPEPGCGVAVAAALGVSIGVGRPCRRRA